MHDTNPVPRDKFAVATAHPVNQILVNFRRTAGAEREGLQFLLTMELAAIRRGDRDYFGSDAREHAEKVLTRYLAAVAAAEDRASAAPAE
ncbi:hypothetical protein [Curtobacterium sp. MCBD17_040]|uniref:hypothetical protein n=1 Tax=Curtobacterium sp. MCBD17_040 TaxID=2175674 RepID=UPI0024DF57C4|nr:hypothetical protein [Curtobacterium sp. MCBD17_040]WIB65908.1 hypothetical protein DEI94_17485 [Curtobacterium sp. MCBD17_040]